MFMVTEVLKGFLNMRVLAANPSFRHWSPLLCCLMTGFADRAFAGGGLGYSFESSLCRIVTVKANPPNRSNSPHRATEKTSEVGLHLF